MNRLSKISTMAIFIAIPIAVSYFSNSSINVVETAYAAKPINPGGGGGGGSGKGDLFADLVLLLRDEHGLPILDVNGCVQPVTPVPIVTLPTAPNPTLNLADGRATSLIPLVGTSNTLSEEEPCDVWTVATGADQDYTVYTQEVLFGRLNLGRSPIKVLAQQLTEVTSLLSGASLITLDAGGRFVADAFTVDSPGNNLAIHKELQVNAELKDPLTGEVIPLPSPANDGFLDHAAAALGGAAGKEDLISIDLVVYNNRTLKIPDDTNVLPTLVGTGGSNGSGETGEIYIDYDNYGYNRSSTFPGCINGLLIDEVAGSATPFKGTLINCAFGDGELDENGVCSATGVDFTGVTGVDAFAQRADDTRAVIAFTHDNVTFNVDRVGENSVCGVIGTLPPLAN